MIASILPRAYCVVLFTFFTLAGKAQPGADFSANKVKGCAPMLVNFLDQSSGTPAKWKWDLGNGTISFLQNPSVSYFNPGHYTIKLVVSNSAGTDSITKVQFIDVAAPPVVKFTASITSGCFPLPVQFTDQSTGQSDSLITWQWDFGDGYSSHEQNPKHIYNTPGSFNATLRVFNSMGCMTTLSKTQYITINDGVKANFTNSVPNVCTAPVTINFQNTSTGTGNLLYKWIFGDGTSSALTDPAHTFNTPGTYTVKLITTNTSGCTDTLTRTNAFVVGNVFPGIASDDKICAGKPVVISSSSTPIPTEVKWDFGDGISDTGISVLKIYPDTGTFQIKLTANFGNCVDSAFKTVTVIPGPVAAFIADDTASCSFPFTVNFSHQSLNAVACKWDFGDSTSSNSLNPSHVYKNYGDYTVQLVVTSANGCTDTIRKTGYVTIIKPKINLNNLPDSGCVPFTKSFSCSVSTVDSVISYFWDFGDGSSSTDAAPLHTYTTQGIFAVKLIIGTSGGCSDTIIKSRAIITNTRPVASFSATPRDACAKTLISFTDETGNASKWLWDFGDGTTSMTQNPIHLFNDTGYFSIQLIAWNGGCPDTIKQNQFVHINAPIARFTQSFNCATSLERTFTNISVGADEWHWNFGDSTSSDQYSPVHSYTLPGIYNVSLLVKNNTTGCDYRTEKTIQVLNVKAQFVASDTIICKGNKITFNTNLSLSDVRSFSWDFGDGSSGDSTTSTTATHLYTKTGNFTIRLITTDLLGCKDTLTKPAYIRINGPTAKFTPSAPGSCLNSLVTFNDASTTDNIHAIQTWTWNYGDGNTSILTSAPFQHRYNMPGAYNVKLTVTDNAGCADSINIAAPFIISKPAAKFTALDPISCPSKTVRFSDQSTGPGLGYLWNFGDGITDSVQNPLHNYLTDGQFTVKLLIKDIYGCTDSISKTSVISVVTPVANFLMSDSFSICPPLIVQFTNLSKNAVSQSWDFGDGTSANILNPSHFYSYPGIYTITLTVTAKGGCIDVLKKDIIVKGPKGTFTYNPKTGCVPLKINFSAKTEDRISFIWDYNDGSTVSTTDSVLSYSYSNPGIYVPKMILIDANGCQVPIRGKDTIDVSYVSAIFDFVSKPYCDSANVSFVNNSASNDIITGYTWHLGDGSISTLQNPQHQYLSTGIYYPRLTVNTLRGCRDSMISPVPVKVVASPKTNLTSTANGCTPVSITFKGLVTSPDTSALKWNWTFGNGNISTIQNPLVQLYNTAGQYNVKLAVTNSSGCTDTHSKLVEAYLIPTVSAGKDTTICNKKGIVLQATGAAGYTWSPAAGLSCISCATPVATPDSARKYIVKGTTVHGCSATDTILVKVKYPFKIIYSKTDTICKGQNIKLFADGADRFQWSPGTGLNSATSAVPIARPDTSTKYRVIGFDDRSCFSDTGFVFVKVYPIPTVDAGEDKTINIGQSLDLVPEISADVSEVIWSPTGNIFRNNYPAISVKPNQNTDYTVEVKNKGGCSARDNITVHVICNGANVFIPNTFSPNGDGANDIFYPRGTGLFKVKSLRLFNRWGEMIFERTNFDANNPSLGWDGTYKGVKLGSDVFVYMVDIVCDNNGILTYKGNVALLQ